MCIQPRQFSEFRAPVLASSHSNEAVVARAASLISQSGKAKQKPLTFVFFRGRSMSITDLFPYYLTTWQPHVVAMFFKLDD